MNRQDIKTYEEAVEYLLNIPRFTSKNSMEDTKAFLARLGNPDRQMKIIHVAGTNGKGSVCAYLRCMLEAAGYSVCVFTSPHLVDVRERFLMRGKMVSKEKFLEAFLSVYDRIPWETLQEDGASEGLPAGCYHPTFFEYLFFMAMLLFKEEQPDYVILETGLGGRLDATNSVSQKSLSVITRISLDHVEYLGDTPEKIAAEKAGIIAQGTPVVYLDTSETVSAVFDERAKKLGSMGTPVSNRDYAFRKIHNKNIDFSVHTRYYNDIGVRLRTTAIYQMENATLAIRALEELDRGRSITKKNILDGLENCFWAGRMEEVLPDIYVDGAHNEDGVRAFLETVEMDGFEGERVLLFSAVKDKAYDEMLGRMISSGLFDRIRLVHMKTGRATDLQELKKQALYLAEKFQTDLEIVCHGSVEEALDILVREKTDNQRIYIAGSLYLAGEVKAYLGVFDHD